MAKLYVGITDDDWFRFLSARPHLDEVNFWQPGGTRLFKTLAPGEPFLFKLHSPNNFIAGGGFFAHSSLVPVSIAWESFGEKNGVASLMDMRRRLERYRGVAPRPHEDYTIGCVVLQDAFFFERSKWIPSPADFALNIVSGRSYDLLSGTGKELWQNVVAARAVSVREPRLPTVIDGPIYGDPVLARRRLGQGAFRLLVTDSYERRCAVTGEKTLIILDAAHIRPVSVGGEHRVDNGLLLRSDVHTLFDRGYVTITPDYKFQVSPRLKADWDNGKVYYDLGGRDVRLPRDERFRPSRQELEWHADAVFLK
jgi:putative restriction endonuclease